MAMDECWICGVDFPLADGCVCTECARSACNEHRTVCYFCQSEVCSECIADHEGACVEGD